MAVLKYKSGDTFVTLTNYSVQPIVPVQTTGASLSDVMSQKAVTDELAKKQDASGLTDAIVDAISGNSEVKSAVNNQVEDAIKNDSDVKDAINNQVASAVETSPTVSGAISNVVAESVENSEAVKNAIADAVESSESISSAISNVVADAISDDDAVKEAVNAAVADAISGSSAVTEVVEAVIAEATSGKLDTDSFDTYSGEVATAINAKADATSVTEEIEAATSGKMDTTEFASYSANVETAIESKADTSAVTEAIETATSGKLDTDSFNTYSGAVDTSIGTKLASSDFETYTAATATELGNKADSSAVTNDIAAATSGKLDTTAFETFSGNVDTALASKFAGAAWNSTDKKIYFYDNASSTGTALAYIDGTEFVKDGMIDSVVLEAKSGSTYLVITWNTDAGKEVTELNIGDIFEADNYYTKSETSSATEISDALNLKVDKVEGKGLSKNDFTDELLAKLNGIASGAEVNVQADWDVTDNTSDAYIANKPTIPTTVAELSDASNYVTVTNVDSLVAQAISEDETVYSAVTEAVASAISDSQTVQTAIDNAVSGKADANAVTQEIEAATSGKLDTDSFVTYSGAVNTALDGKVDDAEITDMATKTWVGEQGYLTEHQSLSAYSTTSEMNVAIDAATSGKSDVGHTHEASAITNFDSAIATSLSNNATVSGALNTAIVNAVAESEDVQGAINTQVASAITTNETVQQAIASEIEHSSAISGAINSVVAEAISSASAVTEAVETVVDAKLVNYTTTSGMNEAIEEATSGKVNTSDFATYSGNVDTALGTKFAGVNYISEDKKIYFYNNSTNTGDSIGYINTNDFVKDGMVSSAVVSGSDLVIIFNTDAGKDPVSLPIADIFDASNYYTTAQTSSATEISTALSLKANSADVYTTGNTSSATEISDALATKQDSGNYVSADTFNTHTESTSLHFSGDEKANLDALATNIAAISGISSTNVGNWDSAYGFMSGISASVEAINSLTSTVGTMAFANAADYSSATEVETALGSKADTTAVTNDIAAAVSGKVNTTDFASYSADVETAINAKVSAVTLSSGATNGTLKLTVNGVDGSDIEVPGLGTMAFVDAASYSSATEIANALGSGFTVSSVTDVIESNELVIATAVNDLNTRKADASAITEVANDVATISGDVITLSGDMASLASQADLNTVSGKADSAKAVTDFYSGHNTVSTLADIPTDKRLVIATIDGSTNQLSLSGNTLEDGYEIHIIITNTGSDITVSLPSSGGYVSVGESITIKQNVIGEINIISDGTNMYVRGA